MNTAKGVHDLTYRIKSEAHFFTTLFDYPASPIAYRLILCALWLLSLPVGIPH